MGASCLKRRTLHDCLVSDTWGEGIGILGHHTSRASPEDDLRGRPPQVDFLQLPAHIPYFVLYINPETARRSYLLTSLTLYFILILRPRARTVGSSPTMAPLLKIYLFTSYLVLLTTPRRLFRLHVGSSPTMAPLLKIYLFTSYLVLLTTPRRLFRLH